MGTVSLIGRITPAGVITEYRLPNPLSAPCEITAGPDGNLWFTECRRTRSAGSRRLASSPSSRFHERPELTLSHHAGPTATSGSRSARQQDRADHARRRRHRVPAPRTGSGPYGDHRRPRRQPLVHGVRTATGSAGSRPRRHHRVPDSDRRERPAPDHRRPRRKPLVHGARRQQDRAHHDCRRRHGIRFRRTRAGRSGSLSGPRGTSGSPKPLEARSGGSV